MALISVIMVFGMVVGSFLGVLLLFLDNRNKTANRFLGLFMIILSAIVSGFGLTKFGLYRELPHLIAIASTIIFLLGPVFYFYVQTAILESFQLSVRKLLHFLPFLILIIYLSPFFVQSGESKLITYETRGFAIEHRVIISLQIIHAFIYLFIIKKFVKNNSHGTANSIPVNDRIKIKWINTSVNVFAAIISCVALFLGLLYAGIKIHPVYSALIPILISLAIISLGFIGLKQPIVFPPDREMFRTKKYEKSTLTDEQAKEYLEKLRHVMQNDKVFLDKDLTLQRLAERISISAHHLSQILNEKINQSFFDFINSYRVEEARKLLSGPKGELLTILAISEESGFNSKSSFNSAFKKITGKTPSEYKQEISSENS